MHSNHGEHPERFPPGRVVKAAGRGKETVSPGAACVRKQGMSRLTGTHTNTQLWVFSAEDCSRWRVCHSADSWDVKRRLQRPEKNR